MQDNWFMYRDKQKLSDTLMSITTKMFKANLNTFEINIIILTDVI